MPTASIPARAEESATSTNIRPILRLQRMIGNRAVNRLIDMRRQAAGSESGGSRVDDPDPEHLSAPELAGEDFDAAYHNHPSLSGGDTRVRAVAVLQTLLADRFGMRALMPQTFRTGSADGQWGAETTAAVRSFQETHGVRPVGGWEAGHKTLLALDRAIGIQPPPPVSSSAIELKPGLGVEAGPSQVQGDKPYDITVVGHGFGGVTPLFISFEDEAPVHAVADANGNFSRSFTAARRSRGVYRVRARTLTTEVSSEFRVVPADQPVPNPQTELVYARFLREATRMLRDSNFGVPLSADFEHDHFDTEFWEWEGDPKYKRHLRLKSGKLPAQAIDALFARLSDWEVDCDFTVQIANLYAERMANGAALFNQRQGLKMELKSRESSGLTTRRHYGRGGPSEAWRIVQDFVPPNSFVFAEGPPLQADTQSLLAGTPAGSRVRWTNLLAESESSFRHENAVKLGPDLYAAAGIDDPITGNEFTRDALEIRLALMTIPKPTRQDIRRTIYIDELEIFDR